MAAVGRAKEAIQLLSDNIVYDSESLRQDKTLAETNARLLSLLAGLVHNTSAREGDLFKAESYAAWAIRGSYCEATYWKLYVDIRLGRETYAPFVGAVRRGESMEYPLQPVLPRANNQNSPSRSWTLTFPPSSEAPLVEALLYLRLGENDRATPLLAAYQEEHNVCPINDLLSELDLQAGNPKKAIARLRGEVADARFGISAYRMVLYGQAQRAMGDLDDAQRSFTEALRIDDSVYDAESALQAIASGETADVHWQESYLKRNPDDWRAWSSFWGPQYLSPKVNIQEFTQFARDLDRGSGLVAPKLAQGLVSLYFHDFESALTLVDKARRTRNTGDVAFASFALHLVAGEYSSAAGDITELSKLDLTTALKLKNLGCTESQLVQISNNSMAATKQFDTGKLLLRVSQAFPENAYAQTAFSVFVSEMPQQTSGGILVSVIMDDLISQGQTAEKRYQTYLRQYATLRGDLAIQANHTMQVESQVRQISSQVAASEQRLASMIDQRDQRLSADLDRLAGLVSTLRGTMPVQQAALDDIVNWRTAPSHQVAHQVASLSGILSALSNAVAVDASFSRVELNMVGVLADILMLMGA